MKTNLYVYKKIVCHNVKEMNISFFNCCKKLHIFYIPKNCAYMSRKIHFVKKNNTLEYYVVFSYEEILNITFVTVY